MSTIRVIAVEKGYYGDVRRKVGSEFDLTITKRDDNGQPILPLWVRIADGESRKFAVEKAAKDAHKFGEGAKYAAAVGRRSRDAQSWKNVMGAPFGGKEVPLSKAGQAAIASSGSGHGAEAKQKSLREAAVQDDMPAQVLGEKYKGKAEEK